MMDTPFGRRALLASAAAAGLAPALSGVALAQGAAAPRRGGTLSVHMPYEQRILNPAIRASIGVYVIASKIMEPLVDINERGEFEPMLATAWEGTPDGQTITVTLRQGVTWHDGKPFTAADVQFTAMEMWKKHLNYGTVLHQHLTAVDTPDAHTAVFRYARPMPFDLFLGALPDLGYIAPRHVYEGTDILNNPANAAPIGTGPFRFVQYERGQFVIAERNPTYWRQGFPYLDRIVWRFIADKAAAAAALESGQVMMSNYSSLSLADMDRLSRDRRFEVSTRGNERSAFQNTIEFNFRRKELADPRVRRAVLHAVDTDFFIENFLYGQGKRGQGPIPSSSAAFFKTGAADYRFDRAQANRLLDEAGLPRRGGTRFNLTLLAAPWGEDIPLFGTFIQQSLAEVGIPVRLETPDAATFLTRVYRDFEWDMSTNWHIWRADPAVSTTVWYRSGSPRGAAFTNQSGWVDEASDRMIDEAAFETDTAKRRALYPEWVRRVNADAPLWMATERQYLCVTNRRLQNHHNNPRWPSSHWADLWLQA